MPITDFLTKNADFYPNDVALVEINPKLENQKHLTWREYSLIVTSPNEAYRREITWSEFNKKANRFANLLLSRGIKKGDKVAILLMNCLEWLPIYFGILKSGAVVVPLNYRYTAEEIKYCLEKSDSSHLIFGPEFTGRIEEICERMPKIKSWLYVGEDCPTFAESYENLLSYCSEIDPRIAISDEDDGAIYFQRHDRLPESHPPCAQKFSTCGTSRAKSPQSNQRRRISLYSAALSYRSENALVRQLISRRQIRPFKGHQTRMDFKSSQRRGLHDRLAFGTVGAGYFRRDRPRRY